MAKLALMTVVVLLLAPSLAWAGGGRFGHVRAQKGHGGVVTKSGFAKGSFHHHHHQHHQKSVFPIPVDPWKSWGVKKHHHHHHGHHGFHSGFVAPGLVYGGGYVYPTPVYAPEPVVYAPAPAYAVAPMPTVVEYATGRYELRGDGITTAYQWVWIPRPPAGPPPPPEAKPEAEPQSRPPARERSIGKIYRWTDDEGVTTFTDRLENVPPKYRPRAEPKA